MKKLSLGFILMIFSLTLFAQSSDEIIGKWLTANGKSIIEITRTNNAYEGKIIWLKEPKYPKGDENEGLEKMDIHNPDKSKRKNKLLGLKLLWGFKYKKGKWVGGKIYDPESGKTYYCKIKLNKDKNLVIKGSIDKWGMVGRSTVWTKVTSKDEKNNRKN